MFRGGCGANVRRFTRLWLTSIGVTASDARMVEKDAPGAFVRIDFAASADPVVIGLAPYTGSLAQQQAVHLGG